MKNKLNIEFVKVDEKIDLPITKFGGQPNWYGASEWPISKRTGKQMMFICQIELKPELFGNIAGKMAYLFEACA